MIISQLLLIYPHPRMVMWGKAKMFVWVRQRKIIINACVPNTSSFSLQQKPEALKSHMRMEWKGLVEGTEMGTTRMQDSGCIFLFTKEFLVWFFSAALLCLF